MITKIVILILLMVTCIALNPRPKLYYEHKRPLYTWTCHENKCVKSIVSSKEPTQSVEVCKLKCGKYRTLWPRPTGNIIISDSLVSINSVSVGSYSSVFTSSFLDSKVDDLDLVKEFEKIMISKLNKLFGFKRKEDEKEMKLFIMLNCTESYIPTFETNEESYSIHTQKFIDHFNVSVYSTTYFGLTHGVETLFQLIIFDAYSGSVVMPEQIEIYDKPVYPYRGVMVDTARNFISVDTIKRTIDGMSMNKLNYFHWHITDSQSFPLESSRYPFMTESGAYGPDKIYTIKNVKDILLYGLVRGVHVFPELDTPGHVGEGWNSIEHYKDELLVCFKKEPWTHYCVEPPCGQLNPVSDRVYEVLGDLYREMTDLFQSHVSGLFHMGGDEVNINCWKNVKSVTDWMKSKNISQTTKGFISVWNYYQNKALSKLLKTERKPKRAIIWSSSLTEGDNLLKYVPKSEYIIQYWSKGNNSQFIHLINNSYSVIFSNYDGLYFDCGFGAWVGEGNNWCSPYIGWQKVYDNDPLKILEEANINVTIHVQKLILGAEATIWTEQIDDASIDGRLWPRAAAMAERLWSNPKESWRNAEYRLLHHRRRLKNIGIQADAIEPEWCYQNDGFCGER